MFLTQKKGLWSHVRQEPTNQALAKIRVSQLLLAGTQLKAQRTNLNALLPAHTL
jgi:hypothetical protein